ncbi:hypothetical protein CAC42_1092 [Sphaceloma murrayae]|uniref:Glucanase n=1 Tax=Sphaceloma murrayae TaxID=2082308 RepID=A0A2K1R2A2_9PEZI|nr:hypothetical protein CAC42_1092 [Sphaceloma murrayae]
MAALFLSASLLLGAVSAQGLSNNAPEVHPKITTFRCTKAGGCVEATNAVVIDSGSHNIRQREAPSLSCGDWGNGPNTTVCPDAASCSQNCIMDGLSLSDYSDRGVTTNGTSLRMDMLRDSDLSSLSPRVYFLTEDEQNYEMLKLTGQEFSFDVDMSKLPCGMNAALYLSEMAADGGRSELNPGGATYGTGYCDAQCYVTPFLNGEGNIDSKGVCCPEMDIWEANSRATAIAPHPCNITSVYGCTGTECQFDGVCDKYGCSHNPYRIGDKAYYGPGLKLDTRRPITVVTQFPADDKGDLIGYKRLYLQDGAIVSSDLLARLPALDRFDDTFCAAAGAERYLDVGAARGMGAALTRGMVLALSIWWDEAGFMNWLDGGEAGPCNATEGAPAVVRALQPDTEVTFSAFKWGEMDSTYSVREAGNGTLGRVGRRGW